MRPFSMCWEELTGDEWSLAVERAEGVGIVPCSVIERHGHHLPLGTDMYIGRDICRRAGTAGKGEVQLQRAAERLASTLRLIKEDEETPHLLAEFYGKAGDPGSENRK